MRAGSLDRRVTIQRPMAVPSPSGEPAESWRTLGTRWAARLPVRGDERFAAPQVTALEQIEFRVRWSADIADLGPRDRIIEPALAAAEGDAPIDTRRIHDVLAVHEIGRREGLRILTARRP